MANKQTKPIVNNIWSNIDWSKVNPNNPDYLKQLMKKLNGDSGEATK